jgi:hypothetical protein
VGGLFGSTLEPIKVDANNAVFVNQSTSTPFDDGILQHNAALFPQAVFATGSAGTATMAMFSTTTQANAFIANSAPPLGMKGQGWPSMFDARHVRLYIDNNATGATSSISNIQIVSLQTTGNSTETITYNPTGSVAIANNSNGIVDIPTPRGIYASPFIIATVSGTVGQITVQPLIYSKEIYSGVHVDQSGTITNGGTAQGASPQNITRRYLIVQNSGTSNLWVSFDTIAVQSQPSLQLVPGAYLEYSAPNFVPTGTVSVIGPTTGQAFSIKVA